MKSCKYPINFTIIFFLILYLCNIYNYQKTLYHSKSKCIQRFILTFVLFRYPEFDGMDSKKWHFAFACDSDNLFLCFVLFWFLVYIHIILYYLYFFVPLFFVNCVSMLCECQFSVFSLFNIMFLLFFFYVYDT